MGRSVGWVDGCQGGGGGREEGKERRGRVYKGVVEPRDGMQARCNAEASSHVVLRMAQRLAVFEAAAKRVRDEPGRLSNERLVLYGYYKQSMFGDAPLDPPDLWSIDIVGRARHSAWAKLRGMPYQAAMEEYVSLEAEYAPSRSASLSRSTSLTLLATLDEAGLPVDASRARIPRWAHPPDRTPLPASTDPLALLHAERCRFWSGSACSAVRTPRPR